MNDEEFKNKPEQRTRRYIGMKSITDLGMGIIYAGVGIFILLAEKFNFTNEFTGSIIGKTFAVLVMLYGGWRIYRGIKKDYFIEE